MTVQKTFRFLQRLEKMGRQAALGRTSRAASKTGIEQGRIAVVLGLGVWKQAVTFCLLPPLYWLLKKKKGAPWDSWNAQRCWRQWKKGLTKPSKTLAGANTKF